MAFIPVPGAAEVVVTNHMGTLDFVNVFGYELPGTLDQTLADDIGSVMSAAYGELLGATSDQWESGTVKVTDLTTVTGAQFVATTYGGVNGSDTANDLPWQTAALISWDTNTRGRSYRGRTYLGGFAEDHSDGRDLSTDLKNALGDFVDDILADGNFGVISRFSGVDPDTGKPIPRDEGIITKFTSGTVHPLWRTQRRRATR